MEGTETVNRETLVRASEAGIPVQLYRHRNWDLPTLIGFIIGRSQELVALQTLSDGVYFDGYDIVPLAEVTDVEEKTENGYVERAVAALGRPKVDFVLPEAAGMREALLAASAHSPLICVYLEGEDDGPLLIGKVTACDGLTFEMMLINPGGIWTDGSGSWSLGDVTRIAFGDRYSKALEEFGDPYPSSARGQRGAECLCGQPRRIG